MLVEVFDKAGSSFYLDNTCFNKAEDLRKEFLKRSIVYQSYYNDAILDYCVNSFQFHQTSGNVEYLTNKLGWQHIPGRNEPEFILKNITVPNFPPILYAGGELDFTNGTLKGQLEFIKDEILPYKETRLAFVMGLTSVVSSYIQPHKSIGTLVVNVAGKSSTGKSTISELSASMFGDPKTSNHGLVRTFNATKTFLLEMTAGRNGLPIILDDANANPNEHSISDLIYQFDMGETRGRCNSNGSAQTKKTGWSGLVLITSESPLLDMGKLFKGALVRTLTLKNIGWTRDKDHSDRIKQGVRENFGFFGKKFAEFVSKKGKDAILELHKKYEQIVLQKMTNKDDLSYRMASKLAPFGITAELINELLRKEVLDVDEIISMIVNSEQQSVNGRDKKEEFMDKILSFININRNNFNRWYGTKMGNKFVDENRYKPTGKVYGSIYRKKENSYVLIDKTVFLEFLKRENITGWSNLREELAKDNIYIKREAGHWWQKANTGGLPSTSAKIMLDVYNYDEDGTTGENICVEENYEQIMSQEPNKSNIDFSKELNIDEIFNEE